MNQQKLNSKTKEVDSLQNLLESWIPQQTTHQNGDKVSSESRNVDSRLCLKNVPKDFERTDIEKLYSVTSVGIHFPKSKGDKETKQNGFRMVFVQFTSRRFVQLLKHKHKYQITLKHK